MYSYTLYVPVSAGQCRESNEYMLHYLIPIQYGRCRGRRWWGTGYRLPDHMFLDAVPTKATCVLSHTFWSSFLHAPLPQSPKPCNQSAATPRLGDNGDANTINGLN